ncbi:MAG: hypothetical protein ACYTEQ_01515 [Planctomycetota bacterium]|jgi:hypothetical protein
MQTLSTEELEQTSKELKYWAGGKRWICETLREIYDIVDVLEDVELRKRLTGKLIRAMWQAKKMNKKLVEYKADYDAGLWEPNRDMAADEKRRRARYERERG